MSEQTDNTEVSAQTVEDSGAAVEEEASGEPGKPKREYEIDIFRAWCKACGICAAFCPRSCIELDEDGSPVVVAPDRCTGCGWCEIHCPDFAISVGPRKQEPLLEEDVD